MAYARNCQVYGRTLNSLTSSVDWPLKFNRHLEIIIYARNDRGSGPAADGEQSRSGIISIECINSDKLIRTNSKGGSKLRLKTGSLKGIDFV